MKKNSYKILKLNWTKFSWENSDIYLNRYDFDKGELEACEIRLEESFTLECIRRFSKLEYRKDMLIEELILIELPKSKIKARKFCKQGFRWNNEAYEYFMSSPSWQKKEGDNYLGCGLFIKEGKIALQHDTIIALNKNRTLFKEIEDHTLPKINSRFSLGLTGAKHINISTNFIVTKNPKKLITSEVLHTKKDNPLESEITTETIFNELFDGCGVCSLEYAKKLSGELGLKYIPSYFQIRKYGMAIKGVITVFDIKKWFEEYGITHIKDRWGDMQEVEDVDLILNDSMCKWAGNFNSFKDYLEDKEKIQSSLVTHDHVKVAKLLDGIWIMKYEKELPIMTRANYQLLTNLTLSKENIVKLANYTVKQYMDVFKNDYNKTMMFLGAIVSNKDLEDDENIIIDNYDTATSKTHILLELNPKMLHDKYVHNQIKRMLQKKMGEVRFGKFYIKGNFKVVVQDPVAFMQYISGQFTEIVKHEDKEIEVMTDKAGCIGQYRYYQSEADDGEIHTISRNPLNHYAEVRNATFTKNELTDKWLSHIKNTFVIGTHDLSCNILSGCDFDGDLLFDVNEPIIRDAVVDEYPVVFLDDGEVTDIKEPFDKKHRIEAMLRGRGNKIGSIANNSTYYSTLATAHPDGAEKGFKEIYRDNLTYLRDCGMKAIDSPKTGINVKVDKSVKRRERPYFFWYLDKGKIRWDEFEKKNSPMSRVGISLTNWCKKNFWELDEYLDEEELRDSIEINKNIHNELLVNRELEQEFNKNCLGEIQDKIEEVYQYYKEQRATINLKYKNLNKELDTEFESNKIDIDEYNKRLNNSNDDKRHEKDILYLDIEEKFKELYKEYNDQLVASICARLIYSKRRSRSFLYRFCFEGTCKNIRHNSGGFKKVRFILDDSGDIEWLGEMYSKDVTEVVSDEDIKNSHDEELEQKRSAIGRRKNFPKEFISRCKILKDDHLLAGNKKIVKHVNGTYINVGLANEEGNIVAFIYWDRGQIDDYSHLSDYYGQDVKVEVIELNDKGYADIKLIPS